MRVVSVTEDFNQEPGNAIITVEGLDRLLGASASGPIQVAFKKPGSQDEFLGTAGWQPTECWFGVKQNASASAETFTFALSPDLALEMESRSYELQLKAGGKVHRSVFHWPEVREPASPTNSVGSSTSAADGYIKETATSAGKEDYQLADYSPGANVEMKPYQPINFGSEEKFAKDRLAASDPIEESARPEESKFSSKPLAEKEVQQDVAAESGSDNPRETDFTAEQKNVDKTDLTQPPAPSQTRTLKKTQPASSASVSEPPFAINTEKQREQVPTGESGRPLKLIILLLVILILLAVIAYLFLRDGNNANEEAPIATPTTMPMPQPTADIDPNKVEPKYKPTPLPEIRQEPAEPVSPPAPVTSSTGPTAGNDVYSVKPGEPTTLPVMNNDSGNQISLISIVQQPSHGLITIEAGKQIIYTWLSDSTGNDSFSYRIEDVHGGSAIASVVVMARE